MPRGRSLFLLLGELVGAGHGEVQGGAVGGPRSPPGGGGQLLDLLEGQHGSARDPLQHEPAAAVRVVLPRRRCLVAGLVVVAQELAVELGQRGGRRWCRGPPNATRGGRRRSRPNSIRTGAARRPGLLDFPLLPPTPALADGPCEPATSSRPRAGRASWPWPGAVRHPRGVPPARRHAGGVGVPLAPQASHRCPGDPYLVGAPRYRLVDRRPLRHRLRVLRAGLVPPRRHEGRDGPRQPTYFIGSIFFIMAVFLQYHEAASSSPTLTGPHRRRLRALFRLQHHRIDWWASLIQFVGTLWFNRTTFSAWVVGLGAGTDHHPVWRPDGWARCASSSRAGWPGRRSATAPSPAAPPTFVVDHRAQPGRLRRLRGLRRGLLREAQRPAGQPGVDEPGTSWAPCASWPAPCCCCLSGGWASPRLRPRSGPLIRSPHEPHDGGEGVEVPDR